MRLGARQSATRVTVTDPPCWQGRTALSMLIIAPENDLPTVALPWRSGAQKRPARALSLATRCLLGDCNEVA
eukprot:8317685-Alexandrium_andersonii.AAC.1